MKSGKWAMKDETLIIRRSRMSAIVAIALSDGIIAVVLYVWGMMGI